MVHPNGAGPASGQNVSASISDGIVVTGNVACDGNLQISGRIDGEVHGRAVFVDETGSVAGAIAADQLRVCGAVTGELNVNDLAIEAGGSVKGDITYQRIKVASGAILEGTMTHRSAAAAGTDDATADEKSLRLVQAAAPANPRHVFAD